MLNKDYADKIASLSTLLNGIIKEQTDVEQIPILKDMIKKTKQEFVLKYHKNTITFLENRGRYQTRVGNPRKTVERKSYEDMVNFLYDYYQRDAIEEATLDEAVDKYLENLILAGRTNETAYRKKACYKRMSTPELRKKRVIDITRIDIQKNIMTILTKDEEPQIPVRAVKDYLQILNKIFENYMADGYIKRQPCKMIKATDYGRFCKQNIKSDEDKMFSPEEIKTLWDYEMNHFDNPNSQAILVSMLTGLRAGEIPPIKWEDITNDFIHIYRQQRKIETEETTCCYIEVNSTKNEKNVSRGGRYVPILDELKIILGKIQKYQIDNRIDTEYLFAYPDGRCLRKDSYEQYLHRHCIALGLDITKNHGLRKSFNSLVLIPSGLNPLERSMILGHTPETNERYYSLTGKHLLKDVSEKLSQNKLLVSL